MRLPGPSSRARDAARRYGPLFNSGVRLGSILGSPVRRRLRRPQVLELKTGELFRAPYAEELIPAFNEIWVEERYLPRQWSPRPDPVVIDVGANVGVFTIWAAKNLGARRVIAIEPARDTARALVANLIRNEIDGAQVLQAGLGGSNREATLYRRGAGARDTLAVRDEYGSRFDPLAQIKLFTLDDVFHRYRIERCDLLKLDCEGAEYEILMSASDPALARVSHIAAEYHLGLSDHGPQALEEFLENNGFEVTVFPPLDVEGGHLHASRRS